MSTSNATTPFALGAYLGNPNGSDASAEAAFDSSYNSFVSTMGAAPTYLDNYVDYTQPMSDWVGNAGWQAWSDAQSPDAKSMTPVIGLPMASTASGSASADAQYQAIAAGQEDSVYQGIVQAYAASGYTNLVFRPGWEMNLQGPTYAGDTAQDQADWVAAFQHIYTVLHQEAAALGVNVTVVWNPGTTNYSNAEAITNLYPGNAYVDAIGADVYSDMYPYSDGTNSSGQATYHDWATGGEDTSISQFMASAVNREHYWTYPAATEWSNDGSGGHSVSLDQLIQFAEQQGKPFAIPETGAGNSDAGTDVSDDAAFPQWLAQQLTTAEGQGEKIDFVNLWDSNAGGNYEFSNSADGKPQEAAAWAQYFGAETTTAAGTATVAATATATASATAPAAITLGSGHDSIVLNLAEDAYQGDAQYTVSVDGTQVGGTQTETASHAAGLTQQVTLDGDWGDGNHTVSVDFLNDAYGGSASTDRNLYVTGASYDGTTDATDTLTLLSSGTQSLTVGTAPPGATVVGSGADTIALGIAEDYYGGNAQFTVSVDGKQVGGTLTAVASEAAGQSQVFDVEGNFGAGQHTVSVDFLNDAYGGTTTTDRNLYVTGAAYDGTTDAADTLSLMSSGSQALTVGVPAAPVIFGLSAATDTGASSTDGITSDAAPTVTGTAQAGSTVTLHDASGAVLGSGTAAGSGIWSIAVGKALANGTHAVTATSTAAGDSSAASAAYTVTVDTAAPTVTAASSAVGKGSTLASGQTDVLSLATSEAVTVAGAPTLSLGDGGVATFDAANSTRTSLAFDYVPTAGQTSTDLLVSGLNLNGGSITDTAGNALVTTGIAALSGSNTGVAVNPVASTPVVLGSGSDTIALQVSEDAWQGNAQFTVAVDGVQVGGTQTATASHAAGQSQTFDVEGNWGLGTQTVTVDFLNDAYGGTAATDRNLYVTGASYQGGTSSQALSLMSSGAQSLAVTSSTAYAPGAAGGPITTRGNDTVTVGSGAVTVHADGPSVDVIGGAGKLTFIGGSGTDTVVGGAGAITITGGTDTLLFTAGTGKTTITAGSGREVYDLVNGKAGGTISIADFVAGTDSIHLAGYAGTGITSEKMVSGSTQIVLTDQTKITLVGVNALGDKTLFS